MYIFCVEMPHEQKSIQGILGGNQREERLNLYFLNTS